MIPRMLGMGAPRCPWTLLLFLSLVPWTQSCPVLIHSCKCVGERSKPGVGSASTPRKKVVCTNEDLLEVPDPALLPNKTATLILSHNKITILKTGSFYGLHDLEKLDLKNNLISRMEPGAFLGLTELKRLDISNNRIGCVDSASFKGLSSLSRLILSGNIFSSLNSGVFDELPSLKLVDFSSEFLTCDCHLRWVPSWTKNGSAQISDRTMCVFPSSLRDWPLRNLKENQLTCERIPELHTHQLIPSLRQVVFQGDRLPIQCTASYLGNNTQIIWFHNGRPVEEDEEMGIILEKTIIHDCTFITSELILSNILVSANGEWECNVLTEHGNISKKVELVVLETSASYCPAERVSNNRGEFRWPRTLAGITSYQSCLQFPFTSVSLTAVGQENKAFRRCDRSGQWEEGDYSNCLYTNDITRVLYTFVLTPINASNVLTLAHQLRMYTAEAANFSDMMDVIYVAQMMEKFVGLVDHVRQLADVMLKVASNMMQVDDHILWLAQVEDKACSSIVQTVEKIASMTLSSNSQDLYVNTRNIALQAYLIKPDSYVGLSCTAFQARHESRSGHKQNMDRKVQESDSHADQHLKFHCTTGRTNISLSNFHVKNSLALASVHLPPSLFAFSSSPSCKLQVLAFKNGKLFRSVGNSSRLAEDGKRRSISTPVIYVGTRGCGISNLTDPVIVTLRHLVKGSDPLPAQWNFKALEGYGGWNSEGCQLLSQEPNITSMQCHQLSNFAILTELSTFYQNTQNGTEVLHPVIYSCTAILLLCLFTTIITYIVNHSSIQISRKGWHMQLNLCFHIAMTSAVFAGGINLTGYLIVCQVVSILLHYSSLSTLLWMGLKARVIYKELTHKPQPPQEGEATQPLHRPMLRFYLIAGGIPLIICGITAAVNINNHRDNSPDGCLVWRPSLGAFYVPAALILLVTWIYLLCAGMNLKRQPAEHKDVPEPSDPQQPLSGISHLLSDSSSISVTMNSSSPMTDVDTVYSLEVQFWGLVIVHALYIALWVFGALAVSQHWYFNIIFSCLYGVTAVALGLFIFIHHCIRRQDVRNSWFSCCPSNTDDLPMQAYVHTASPVDDSPQVYIGCNAEVANSVKSSSSPSSSSNSNTGPCKMTNLQVAQNQVESCTTKPASCEDSEPVNNKNVTVPSRYMNNLHGRRNHKGRTKQYREGKHHRLKVLRSPSSDQPSSESGSIQNSHSESYHSRSSPLNNGQNGIVARDPEGALTHSEGSDSSGHHAQDFAKAQKRSASRDNLKQANSMERENKRRSYPLNMANQNGVLKGSKYDVNITTTESTAAMKTGLWKSETTV
ncbi:adhesion G protein-coupled receptor A2 [Bombina bombina]|uniref:adhesion G protein-coupled receptor A2 n=1 Tax=Bombina bombina TaxID=8345 RepID=UPI00235B0496|nr:adhesion G protein-coupled receptor A2 [Bombina bombina]